MPLQWNFQFPFKNTRHDCWHDCFACRKKRVLKIFSALQIMQSGGQGGGGSHQQILQTQDGQQIVVQQSGPNGSIQQVQVVPVQSAGGQQILIQQQPSGAGGGAASQQAQQVIQTPDGQTLIYQPIQVRSYAKFFFAKLLLKFGRLLWAGPC